MVSGSAPMPRWLLERFHGLGWLVLEAYGISENVIPVAANTPERYRFGSVGQPLPGNELRVADDQELLIRGPGVFSGYYGESADTAPISPAGFLHTGDYARIDADGYVWLEGRKSDVFKTSTGRRVAPAPIEAALKQIDYVDHAVIVGRDRPYPVAILALDPAHPIAGGDHPTAKSDTIAADVAAACEAFSDYQRPGAIILSLHPFTIAAGELTANLKIRRKPIEERFRAQIEEAYEHAAARDRASPFRPRVINAP
jgi:long-chain acyl-CoA synthetase